MHIILKSTLELRKLFVQARVPQTWRVKLADAGYEHPADLAYLATEEKLFEEKFEKLFPEIGPKPDGTDTPQDLITKGLIKTKIVGLWEGCRAAVEHERNRHQKIIDNPNIVPEIKDDDRTAQRNLYKQNHKNLFHTYHVDDLMNYLY